MIFENLYTSDKQTNHDKIIKNNFAESLNSHPFIYFHHYKITPTSTKYRFIDRNLVHSVRRTLANCRRIWIGQLPLMLVAVALVGNLHVWFVVMGSVRLLSRLGV